MTKVDRDALEIVLQYGGELFGKTVFENVHITPEIEWPKDSVDQDNLTFSDAQLEELSNLLSKTVVETLREFVGTKIGLTLSGGVDSSLVLYLLKMVYPDADVVAYHSDWHYPPTSELQYAKMAAEFAHTPLEIVDVSPNKQLPFMDDALSKTKTISFSTIPLYMVFKKMADDGIEVVVNALGLDELFGGYTFHRRYYERSRIRFLPRMSLLSKGRLGPAVARRYGRDKAWFMAHTSPLNSTPMVRESKVDFDKFYEEKFKANTLWNSMHNYLLNSMVYYTGNLIGRPAIANGLKIVFPYMHKALMRQCLDYHPFAKINKAPIRSLMRQTYNFPEELASRGEKWGDKIGWGGTVIPYVQSSSYMDAIKPDMSTAQEWFTKAGLRQLSEIGTNSKASAISMALFLKTLELI
ncbi:MAG: asparagine synthase-related protein [Candidatus Thorarchaeota archaeon]|jgi:asparagine synthetase B (glutamine-hydrolysing)